ncbi:MAG: PadR family transcriptional regulator [Candidatus Thermoplasmatota archaeon]
MPVTDSLERLERDMTAGMMHVLVLSHLRRDGPLHGYGLIKAMEASTGKGLWKEGTVYPLLGSMERDGLMVARWGEPATGPRRKYYQLTPAGRQALRIAVDHWNQLRKTMDTLLETSQ